MIRKNSIYAIFFSFLILALMSINLAAADNISKEVSACKELGILIGADSSGLTPTYLATTPNRAQAFIIFLRLKGLESEALSASTTDNFKDAKTASWAEGYLAYAKQTPELAWQGKPDGTFAPNAKVDSKSFYKVMLGMLGYKQDVDFSFNDTLNFAYNMGLIDNLNSVEKLKSFTINDVAKAIYNTLNCKIKNSDKNLIDIMIEQGIFTTEKAASAGLTLSFQPANVVSVAQLANNKLFIQFDRELTITNADIEITDESGNKLDIVSIVNEAGITDITTAQAKPFAAYKLKINTKVPTNGYGIKNYEKSYVAMQRDTEKPTCTVEVISSTQIRVAFNEEIDKISAEALSSYIIQNNISILEAKLEKSRKAVILTTQEQVPGNFYKLTVQNVLDLSGNAIEKNLSIIEGMAKDNDKPFINTVQNEGNRTISITFNERLNSSTAENINNYILDNNLSVKSAVLDDSGKIVTLTTLPQTSGVIYNLVVQNIADTSGNVLLSDSRRFVGSGGDTTPPTAELLVTSNTEILIKFNEKMDVKSATLIKNYSPDKDLDVLNAVIDSTGKIVTLITSKQTSGSLYSLSISGVADASGNIMPSGIFKFGGVEEDTSPLKIRVANDSSKVIVTFNKRVDPATAENTFNYIFDSALGYATSAKLDSSASGKVVTLQVGKQVDGKQYSLTVKNVKDTSGNMISSDEKLCKATFTGVASTSTGDISLETIIPVDKNTIEIVFSRDITEDDLDDMEMLIMKQNGSSFKAPDGLAYSKYFGASESRVRIQYKTSASTNPNLFSSGSIYDVKISGMTSLGKNKNYFEASFAGTGKENEAPKIESATALNSTAVEVKFSEPVKGISENSFNIKGLDIIDTSVKNTDITDTVILYLSSGSKMKSGADYYVYPKSSIKDAAGYNEIITSSKENYAEFSGTTEKNESPSVSDIAIVDKYTLKVEFSEEMKHLDEKTYSIKNTSSSNNKYQVYAVKPSEDNNSVTIYLNCSNAGFEDNNKYELSLGSAICDIQGSSIESGDRKVNFTGDDYDFDNFEITSSTINSDNDEIKLISNKNVYIENPSMNYFELKGADYIKSSSDKVSVKDNIITITLKNSLKSNSTLTIELTDSGLDKVRSYNNQKLSSDAITINTR